MLQNDRQPPATDKKKTRSAYDKALESLESVSLTHLEVSVARIDDSKAKVLADKIKMHTNLRAINLSGNRIADQGALYIALAVAAHPTIIEVDLGGNQITDIGGGYIAQAIKANKRLQKVILERNEKISDEGARLLAEALEENNTMYSLVLNGTAITSIGADRLITALSKNVTLYDLSFGTLNLSEASKRQIETYRQRNKEKRNQFLTACQNGDTTVMTKLLEEGVSVQATDEHDNTGLHLAARAGQREAVQLLLRRNALLLPNANGKTALHEAEANKHVELAALLRYQPSAYVPVARNLRRLCKETELKDNEKSFIQAAVTDMERLQNEQKVTIVKLSQDIHSELNEVHSEVDDVSNHLDDLEKQMHIKFTENSLEVAALRKTFATVNIDNQRKVERQKMIESFRKHPNLYFCQRRILIKMQELFIGLRAVASLLVNHSVQDTLGKLGSGIELLGTVMSFMPVVGGVAGAAVAAAGVAVQGLDNERVLHRFNEISALFTNSEQKRIAEYISIFITQRFEVQIKSFPSLQEDAAMREAKKAQGFFNHFVGEVKDIKQASDELIYHTTRVPVVMQFAEFCVLKVLEALRTGELLAALTELQAKPDSMQNTSFEETCAELIYEQIVRPIADDSFLPAAKKQLAHFISETFGSAKIASSNPQPWILKEVLARTGVMTVDRKYFAGAQSAVNVYGFRLGNEKEVARLHFKSVSAPANQPASSIAAQLAQSMPLGPQNITKPQAAAVPTKQGTPTPKR